MKYLTKEANFKQIVMSNEFEHLDQSLMVEIIRRHQSPLKSTLTVEQQMFTDSSIQQSHEKCKV
jgi:hypothetical protein